MQIRVSFKHMESSEALATLAKQKFSRTMEKYTVEPTDAHITFSVEHGEHFVDFNLSSSGMNFHLQASSGNMYATVDLVVQKLEAKLHKTKDRSADISRSSLKDLRPAQEEDPDTMDAKDVLKMEEIRESNHQRLTDS